MAETGFEPKVRINGSRNERGGTSPRGQILLQHFLSGGERVSTEMRTVTVQNFCFWLQVFDGPNDYSGTVKAKIKN